MPERDKRTTSQAGGKIMKRKWAPFSLHWLISALALLGFLALLLPSSNTEAGQIAIESWVARYDGPAHSASMPYDMAVDAFGNVYVTGVSSTGGITVKYDTLGNQLWIAPSSISRWRPRALVLDASGNVYVTGLGWNGSSYDFATTKCDPNGNELWVAYEDFGGSTEEAEDICVDNEGNVCVTGEKVTGPTLVDYATAKYDSNGVRMWSATYDGPAHDTDSAWAVATDSLGNTYVTGHSDGVSTDGDCTTVKYDASGAEEWVARWAGAGEVWDGGRAVAVDQSGNVYVAGQSNTNVLTIKYDVGGHVLWSSQYAGGGTARDVKVDASGNVYVAGSYVTIKYGSDGTQVWVSPFQANCSGESLALDNSGSVYVISVSSPSNAYTTVKYNGYGNEVWSSSYGPISGDNWAGSIRDIALDPAGNVYVTCDSPGADGETDYVTIKYVQYNSPSTPSNISPENGANSSSLVSNLRSSPFSDPDAGDTHACSQWQVTTCSDNYDNPVFDSGTTNSSLIQISLPSETTDYGTTYYWHVRYQDNHGAWSDWSAETSFSVGHSPNQPSNIIPPTGTTGVSLRPTLQSSPFSDPNAGDTQAGSQWQVRETSGSYSSPIYDSATDNANLTIIAIPSGQLSHSTTYCWHVRYQDSTGLWSDWSAETFFTTTAKGGLPFWVWIIVGVAAVLIVGVIVYLVGKRPRLGQQTAQTTTGDSRVEQAQKESTSVPDSANTQSKSVPRKGAQWKTVAGWVLFAWGVVGLLANIAFVLVWSFAPLSLVVNSAVCILFLWEGWRLSHPTRS